MLDLTDDLQVLTATIYGEARGEILPGKQAVAAVILNRVNYAKTHHYPMFGDGTFKAACLQPYQFSCWLHSDPNYPKLLSLNLNVNDPIIEDCLDTAEAAMNGVLTDPTSGCYFYKTTVLAWPKGWGIPRDPIVTIGHQAFYKLDSPPPVESLVS